MCAEFTCRTHQGDARQVSRVMGSVYSSDVPPHRRPHQVEGSFIQTNTLHKLHRERHKDRGDHCLLSASVQLLHLDTESGHRCEVDENSNKEEYLIINCLLF